MKLTSNRAGHLSDTSTGYTTFIPNNLPPDPPIIMDNEMLMLLSAADSKLGRLDGITRILPNPDLFLAMYVKKEAILSSQIEGTQASLVDILSDPSEEDTEEKRINVAGVVNYVGAMNYGLERLSTLPLSLRLIREIHGILLQGVRGSDKNPGEFRKTQNWIGPKGCSLKNAAFVPPPVPEMETAMAELEKFFYDDTMIPPLIKIAMIHAQFETIHPFLDGNGRVGRLLITFWLCYNDILSKPLLYLSYYFKQSRTEYYDRLMSVRMDGDWEGWIKYFLKGIASTSDEAISSAEKILKLKENCTLRLTTDSGVGGTSLKFLDYLFEKPIVTRTNVTEAINVTSPTARSILEHFCSVGILTDITPEKQRNKRYHFTEYLAILGEGT